MAESERIRESVQAPLEATSLKQRGPGVGKLVALEWELPTLATAVPAPEAVEVTADLEYAPFGLRVAGDCEHLEQNPAEMQFLLSMMELIIQDISLVKV